jgi:hypothetical protein
LELTFLVWLGWHAYGFGWKSPGFWVLSVLIGLLGVVAVGSWWMQAQSRAFTQRLVDDAERQRAQVDAQASVQQKPRGDRPEAQKEKRGGQRSDWTAEEKQNVVHFFRSLDEFAKGNDPSGRLVDQGDKANPEDFEKVRRHFTIAIAEAKTVRPEVLAKAHPELPKVFKEGHLRFLELSLVCMKGHTREDEQQLVLASNLWFDWFKVHEKDLRIPSDVPK